MKFTVKVPFTSYEEYEVFADDPCDAIEMVKADKGKFIRAVPGGLDETRKVEVVQHGFLGDGLVLC